MGKTPNRTDRTANVQLVLDHLRQKGPSTQAEIARATNLARATVNNIVQALRDQGTLEYNWKNKREALVSLSSARGSIVSILVHSGQAEATLFDFQVQERITLDVAALRNPDDRIGSPEEVLHVAKGAIAIGAARNAPVSGICIAMEGPIERRSGMIARWAWQRYPDWTNLPVFQHFDRHLRVPLVVDNDANLAALAEWMWGVGQGHNDFVHLTCSQGIGGGIIIDGKIYHGGTGLAGEMGHMVIEEDGELCFCGSRGCLTGFASERAILTALGSMDHRKDSLDEVVESAKAGDAACQRVLYEAGVHLGRALATVVRVLGPSMVSLGGTLGEAGRFVFDGLHSSPEIINLRAIGTAAEFRASEVGKDAAMLGGVAAILAQINLGLERVDPWMKSPAPAASEKISPEPDSD
ncbi:ROK family transcriptional regulator [Altererythrobacter sp. B11]|uniref:ROK family transcriptional regulator n=1 Tax=Altererythrobacter sp. B11 TaxID=2060312 RepID=UPI000E5AB985|nr:ROK family transcriptional regulator [Altererythrobacter sp. B11]